MGRIKKEIEKTISDLEESGQAYNPDVNRIDWLAIHVFKRLGVNLHVKDHDEIFRWDDDDKEERWPTWAGEQLLVKRHNWDFRGKPLEDPSLLRWGDASCGYQGYLKAKGLPLKTLVAVHSTVYELLPDIILKRKKAFGIKKNAQLEAAGCSEKEIKIWWRLRWKHEWKPKEFKEAMSLTDEQITYALTAQSHAHLEECGVFFGRSFPRTMDLIVAIARVRKIRRKKLENWDKSTEGIMAQNS